MTRIEKFKSYRDDIAKLSNISYYIISDNKKLIEYENKIKKINPAILHMIETKQNSIISIDIDIKGSENKIPTKIINLFTNLNNAKNSIAKENVSQFLFEIKNKSILNNETTIKEDWLEKNKEYLQIKNIDTNARKLNLNDKNFQEILQLNMNKFKFNDDNEKNIFQKVNLFKKYHNKRSMITFFVISFWIVVISIVLIFTFLIIGMVK